MLWNSDNLFQDVDHPSVDPRKHAPWLVKRVLDQERWDAWQALVTHYDMLRQLEIAITMRTPASRASGFCQADNQFPPSDFGCLSAMPCGIPSDIC